LSIGGKTLSKRIVIASRNQILCHKDSKLSYLNSQYLKNYKKNIDEINKKYEWKTQGINAMFLGTGHSPVNVNAVEQANINGISALGSEDKVIYSVEVENNSGIFIKYLDDDKEMEHHVIHDSKAGFYNLDYNKTTGEVVVSVQQSPTERNIAILDINASRYRVITEGDSIDDNPVWGKLNYENIYFDSTGVGRNGQGDIIGFSPKVINRLNIQTGELCELIAFEGYDCFMPKVDSSDNIYFIKRPYQSPFNSSISIKDIILIPFKILKAIFKWIEFFTIRHTGEPLVTGGSNPAKSKEMDPQQIIINGNIINAQKVMKENNARGEKYPGIAPKEWELVKMDRDGNFTCIKKGVIGYDVDKEGNIIFSNGKYIIRILEDGKEEVVDNIDMIDKLIIV
jgi:hypothetical protein